MNYKMNPGSKEVDTPGPFRQDQVSTTTVSKTSQTVKNGKEKTKSRTVSQTNIKSNYDPDVNFTTSQKNKGDKNKTKAAYYFKEKSGKETTWVQRDGGSERIVQGKRASNVYGRVSKRMKNKI